MIFKRFIIHILTVCSWVYARGIPNEQADSLRKYDYSILLTKIEVTERDKPLQLIYLKAFLEKAKAERNADQLILGYKNYIYYSDKEFSVIYADSMVRAALATQKDASIGSSYLTQGILYYSLKEYTKALDSYLLANEYISKTQDDYLKYKSKYNLAHLKYYLGIYDDAVDLFEECITYFKSHNPRGYLNSLHSLALCYSRMGNYGESTRVVEQGISEGERLKEQAMEPYFVHLDRVNNYFKNNYRLGIEKIASSLEALEANNDFANVAVGNFYIGKSYLGLKQVDKALIYFKKVEETFDNKKYIRPDLRECFEWLLTYYEEKGDLTLKLKYIEKLIKVDSLLGANYKYLSQKIHREYDTVELKRKRNELQLKLHRANTRDKLLIFGVIVLGVLLLVVGYRYKQNQRLYRQRFEELMGRKDEQERPERRRLIQKGDWDISSESTEQLLKQLDKFEKSKKYLDKDLNLAKLAAQFNSNTKYLSKVILQYRDKGFVEYINDLKIDYLVELLKNEKRYRNYTNKALAEDIGFSSTQRFVNAFVSRTGISPTYFIKRLRDDGK